MKKIIFAVILIMMVGWAVYDFVIKSDDSSNKDQFEEVEQVGVATDSFSNEEKEDSEQAGESTVGLNVGNIAPDFQLQTLDGEQVQLSDYRGSRVMLNFWATWCPPCRAEMPDMEKFHQDSDVVILAVNLTETELHLQQVEDFVNEYHLTFPILLDEEIKVATTYAIQPIPTTYMIDSNGIIQYKAFGPMNYDSMIQEFEKME